MGHRVGQQLGNYLLSRLLGRGSFAEVYLGEQIYLHTQAALKILRVRLADKYIADFLNEAQTIAHLEHTHIVPVLDFAIQDGTPFLVMQYAPHGSLRKLHPYGSPLPVATVVAYAKQVASALQFAHNHAVIHRDVKPENMLSGPHGSVLLSDFGLARVVKSNTLHRAAGTITYIAPEQAQGNPCAASDQYALGAVVYEWLCGTPPFAGPDLEISRQHLVDPPPSLCARNPEIPSALEHVVLTALAKDPARRFSSVEAFAVALEQAFLTSQEQTGSCSHSFSSLAPVVSSAAPEQTPLLIGREQELESLREALVAAEERMQMPHQLEAPLSWTSPARAPCTIVLGDAGIGKTRLAQEICEEAIIRGWSVVWSHSFQQENCVSYHVWTDILRNVLKQKLWSPELTDSHLHLYQPLVALLPELAELLPINGSTILQNEAQLLWDAVLNFLAAISTSRPLLIVLDDLHWADSRSCELFTYLVRRMIDYPTLIVATCRENEVPAGHMLSPLLATLQRERLVNNIHLYPLTDTQIEALIPYTSPEQLTYVQRRSAGNPLFAEELARVLTQTDADKEELAGEAGARKQALLPITIATIFEQRLQRLSQPCQHLLRHLSVFGNAPSFLSIHLVERANKHIDEDNLLALLEEALQAGILLEEAVGSCITYRFWHPLLLEHLYTTLSASRRMLLHRRVAKVFQQLYKTNEEEGAAIIVHHLTQGAGEQHTLAYYAALAGNRAYSLATYQEAEHYYLMALDYIAGQQEQWSHLVRLLELLAEASRIQGKPAEARRYYMRALDIRSKHTPEEDTAIEYKYEMQIQALLWSQVGLTWYDSGNYTQARVCYQHCEQMLRTAQIITGSAWAYLHYERGFLSWSEGRFIEAGRNVLEAFQILRADAEQQHAISRQSECATRIEAILAGSPVCFGRAHVLLGMIAAGVGQCSDALVHLTNALNLYEQHNLQRESAIARCNLGDLHLRRAEYTIAQAFFQRALETAQRCGEVALVSIVLMNIAIMHMRKGDLVSAEDELRRGVKLAEEIDDPVALCSCSTYLALVCLEQGKLVEAKKGLQSALIIEHRKHLMPAFCVTLVVLGNLHIAQATLAEFAKSAHVNKGYKQYLTLARKVLQRALACQEIEAEVRIEGRLSLAQTLMLLHQPEMALQHALQAQEEAQRSEVMWLAARSQRLLGSIRTDLGQHALAEQNFMQALQQFRQYEMPLEYARSLLCYALAQLKTERADSVQHQGALDSVCEARELCMECRAQLDLQIAEHLQARFAWHPASLPDLVGSSDSGGRSSGYAG